MITSHTTEPSPQELENAAEAINAMLLTDSSVTDCVTVIHSESNTPFRIYVVGNGARPDRQLRPKIEAASAHFSKGINIAVIAVSNLPLTAAGKINIRLLSKLPVIDEETVAACKRQLQARNPDSQISVDIIARSLPKSLIHYTDLGIQSFQPLKVEDLTNAGQAPAPVIGFADSKED
jgi:hypothetical protein